METPGGLGVGAEPLCVVSTSDSVGCALGPASVVTERFGTNAKGDRKLRTARPKPSDLRRNAPRGMHWAAHHVLRSDAKDGVTEHDEAHRRHDEVSDVLTDDHLPLRAKAESIPMPEDGPQRRFRGSRQATHAESVLELVIATVVGEGNGETRTRHDETPLARATAALRSPYREDALRWRESKEPMDRSVEPSAQSVSSAAERNVNGAPS